MSPNPILKCPSCGARLKIKPASLRALKEVTCAKCRAKIPTTTVNIETLESAPAKPKVALAAPIVITPAVPVASAKPVAELSSKAPKPDAAPSPAPAPAPSPSAALPVLDQALARRVESLEEQLAEKSTVVTSLETQLSAQELAVASLEARLAEQDGALLSLRSDLERLREAGLAAARQQVSLLEST